MRIAIIPPGGEPGDDGDGDDETAMDETSSVRSLASGAELTVPSPKTPSEEKGECARTLGRSLVQVRRGVSATRPLGFAARWPHLTAELCHPLT